VFDCSFVISICPLITDMFSQIAKLSEQMLFSLKGYFSADATYRYRSRSCDTSNLFTSNETRGLTFPTNKERIIGCATHGAVTALRIAMLLHFAPITWIITSYHVGNLLTSSWRFSILRDMGLFTYTFAIFLHLSRCLNVWTFLPFN